MTSEFVMPVNEHIGGLTVLDKGLDASPKRKGSSGSRAGSRAGSRPTSRGGSGTSRPGSSSSRTARSRLAGSKTSAAVAGGGVGGTAAGAGNGMQMLSPEAPVPGAARPVVNVTAADFQAMMARRTGSASSSSSKSATTSKSKSRSKSKSKSGAAAPAAAPESTADVIDVIDADDTTEEERKILEAEDLVRELDALLAEKEKLEKEVKTQRRELIAEIGGPGALAALEAGAASDAANEARILSARSTKPVFFTETACDEETEDAETGEAAADGKGRRRSSSSSILASGSNGAVVKAVSPNKGSAGSSAGGGKVDFMQRNIELAADGAAGALAMTSEERARIAALLGDSDGEDSEGAGGAEEAGGANPFVLPGEESGAGFSYEAATESRLEEINARLASFAGLMALMAAHSSEDGDGQPSVDSIAATATTNTAAAATTTTTTTASAGIANVAHATSTAAAVTPTAPGSDEGDDSSSTDSPAKTDSGQAEIARQERLAQIDRELARIEDENLLDAADPTDGAAPRAEALDRAVLRQLLDSAQEEQRLAGGGSFPGTSQSAEGPPPMPEPSPQPEEDSDEGTAISAAAAAGLPTTAPGKKAVFF